MEAEGEVAYNPAEFRALFQGQINESLSTNTRNIQAWAVKTITLRKLGHIEAAQDIATEILAKDPINALALFEQIQLTKAKGDQQAAQTELGNTPTCRSAASATSPTFWASPEFAQPLGHESVLRGWGR